MIALITYNSYWMQRLLGLLFGLKPDSIQNLTFAASLPEMAVILLLAVAGIWFSFNYWRDGTRPTWWIKGPLVFLRLIALSALLLMLAQPVLRLRHSEQVRPTVFVMADVSDSMNRPDPKIPLSRARVEAAGTGIMPEDIARTTRLARVNALLNHNKFLTELSKRYNVRTYVFAGALHSVPLPADTKKRAAYRFALGPDMKSGQSTQIGDALRKPLEDLAGQPVAGGLIISDGEQNKGDDPLQVAEAARQANIRISTLGFGDPTKTKDVAVTSVLADDTVRAKNTVTAYAALTQHGYAGKTITVTLQRGNEVIDRQTVRLAPDDQKQEVQFQYKPTEGGRFYYTVSAAVQPGEITASNNKKSYTQNVITKKLKVLYVESEPRYEFRYLKNAILRDTSLDFGCLLLSGDDLNSGGEGNIPVHGFPADEKTLFDYEIIVLGDVPRSYFTDNQLQMLRRFVEDRGASLLVIAGDQHMPQEYAGTPLEAVLPTVISPSPDPIMTDDPIQWQLTPEGKRSPIMQLEDDPNDNARVWAGLPGMFWAAGVPRVKPGATVLAVHPTRRNADGPYPLVVSQHFGAGQCYLQLVDGTWRWRWRVGDRYFYRYWGQVFRTLTPTELPGNSRYVQVTTDRNSCLLGEKITVNARLLDAYYHPVKADSATAVITTTGGQTQRITLQAVPNSAGLFTGQYTPERVGHYDVAVTSPANALAKATASFAVDQQALEAQKPELDVAFLKKVASAGGGKYYEPDQLARWIRSLPNNALNVSTEQELEKWDDWRLLALFLTPLSLEWLVRKRKGLL